MILLTNPNDSQTGGLIVSHRFIVVSLALVCFVGTTLSITASEVSQPREIGYNTQLFVDDYIVHSRYGLERKAQPANKMNRPVMVGKYPWETEVNTEGEDQRRVFIYGTVFYDPLEKQYRMWYMGRMGNSASHVIPELELPGENIHYDLTLYATSKDGIHWERPNLGLVHFNGDPDNNIMLDFHGATVFLDQKEPDPKKRYKAIGFIRRVHEIRVCYSPDGVHWSEPVHAVDRYNEGALNGCYVPYLDCYVAGSLERSRDPLYSFTNHRGDVRGKRVALGLATGSKDLNDWVSRAVINPDIKDHPATQFYGMTPFCYGDNNMVFGFLHVFHVTGAGANDDGPIDVELVYSRDGRTWHRLEDRSPIIPLGPKGSFDGGMIMMTANGSFLQDDKLIAYYTATQTGHASQIDPTIGMATWPLDRLVAMQAGQDEAVLETKLLAAPKGELIINANAKGGYFTAEVLDAKGQIQPGFSSDKCQYMVKDSLRYNLTWEGKDLSEATQPMQLRFKLRNAKLYSFTFAK